ncbi:hypothetical protein BS47DRAFT_1391904 [Hydnum rufescens UP504]|uniref:CCR4-NOT transcription complex subunit 1 TTP binding domain-containing protein n=1 Tax=Hydnum rufescens UP504 TaxID=1448309 RepID=A0A9P6B019_9AGAM|nr:hypothetical protein BS47DRAFT_1391904 [Hydnum rufescens UP504]
MDGFILFRTAALALRCNKRSQQECEGLATGQVLVKSAKRTVLLDRPELICGPLPNAECCTPTFRLRANCLFSMLESTGEVRILDSLFPSTSDGASCASPAVIGLIGFDTHIPHVTKSPFADGISLFPGRKEIAVASSTGRDFQLPIVHRGRKDEYAHMPSWPHHSRQMIPSYQWTISGMAIPAQQICALEDQPIARANMNQLNPDATVWHLVFLLTAPGRHGSGLNGLIFIGQLCTGKIDLHLGHLLLLKGPAELTSAWSEKIRSNHSPEVKSEHPNPSLPHQDASARFIITAGGPEIMIPYRGAIGGPALLIPFENQTSVTGQDGLQEREAYSEWKKEGVTLGYFRCSREEKACAKQPNAYSLNQRSNICGPGSLRLLLSTSLRLAPVPFPISSVIGCRKKKKPEASDDSLDSKAKPPALGGSTMSSSMACLFSSTAPAAFDTPPALALQIGPDLAAGPNTCDILESPTALAMMIKRLRESSDPSAVHKKEILACPLHSRYTFFQLSYPALKFAMTRHLFGSIMQYHLVDHISLDTATPYVPDAIHSPPATNLFTFGTEAFMRSGSGLLRWPPLRNTPLRILHLHTCGHGIADIVGRTLAQSNTMNAGWTWT